MLKYRQRDCLPLWSKQTRPGENKFNLLPIKINYFIEEQRQKLKHLSSPLSHAQLHSFTIDFSTPVYSAEQHRGYCGWLGGYDQRNMLTKVVQD